MNPLDVVYVALAGLAAPWWARKARGGWGERLGRTPALAPAAPGRPRILLHAVSVGEVNAIRTLVPLLVDEAEVIVASTTDTGIARARDLFSREARVVRYPLDFSWSVRRFLDSVRPDVAALVELEVWPNFVRECARRAIPVAVINGRLSERSFRGYRKIRRFMRSSFAALEFAAVQDADYASRFEAMGVAPEDCLITGSMKWDAAPAPDAGARSPAAEGMARDFGIDPGRPLVVGGSTAEGEEALLHAACPPGVQLLCAPRQIDRFDGAAAAMPGCIRRSATKGRGGVPAGPDRFLLDSIGELRDAYSLADVVVMGRSFGNLFGSDPIEPIALGKPTVIGPRIGDFAAVVGALKDSRGIVQSDRERLAADLADLLADGSLRERVAAAGMECIRSHRGVSRRHAELLLALGNHRGSRTGHHRGPERLVAAVPA